MIIPCTLLPSTLFRVQTQVSGVINVMRDNINKVLERGDKLEDLEDKSGVCCTILSVIPVYSLLCIYRGISGKCFSFQSQCPKVGTENVVEKLQSMYG